MTPNNNSNPPPVSIPPQNCSPKPIKSTFRSGKYLSPFTLHNLTKSGKIQGSREANVLIVSDNEEYTQSWGYS